MEYGSKSMASRTKSKGGSYDFCRHYEQTFRLARESTQACAVVYNAREALSKSTTASPEHYGRCIIRDNIIQGEFLRTGKNTSHGSCYPADQDCVPCIDSVFYLSKSNRILLVKLDACSFETKLRPNRSCVQVLSVEIDRVLLLCLHLSDRIDIMFVGDLGLSLAQRDHAGLDTDSLELSATKLIRTPR